MAKTLTLAGTDFLPQYKTNSVQIRETIQNKSNVMNLQITVMPGDNTPQEGSEIIFKDGSRFLFGGFVTRTKPREIGKGQLFIFDVEASDYSFIFGSKIARRAYSNQTLKYIVEDLIATYVDSSYGFTTTNVATGPTIDSITFDHISVRKCLEKLQKLTGYVWYVDYQKNIYFTTQTADPAPETITDSSNNYSEISIAYDISQTRNSVICIGSDEGEQSSALNVETFVGDGSTRSWPLDNKPSAVSSITVNGVSKQFSLDVNLRDTDVFVYSFNSQSFSHSLGTTFTGSDTIVISYYPRIPIVAQKSDPTSIAFFAALDGGDGIYEYTIKDPAITSKASAAERAIKELDEFSMPIVNGQFITRTGLLSGGSIFSVGQALTVNLPTYGISSDYVFLIQEVNISLIENLTTTEYQYTVRFGGKLSGVQEFLESLVTEGGEVSNTDNIVTIYQQSESEAIDDSLALSHTNVTPPYHWTSGAPVGKWNKSEWA